MTMTAAQQQQWTRGLANRTDCARSIDAGAAATSSATTEGGGGVRLSYFDENNVMDGAVAAAGLSGDGGSDGGSYHRYNDGSNKENDENNQYPNQYANNYDYGDDDDDDDDDDDEDDLTEASGDTVVHEDRPTPPPPTATQEELNRYYWEWCYGPLDETNTAAKMQTKNDAASSVMRSAPSKSCLSTKKKRKINGTSMTPRRILHHSPMTMATSENTKMPMSTEAEISHVSTPTEAEDINADNGATPKNGVTRLANAETRARTQSAVKFGNNTAAEFDFLQPITEMTPIPSSIVQQIFPSDVEETEKEIEEQGVSRETARNVATLAQWDDDFDSIISEEDDGDDDDGRSDELLNPSMKKRGRKHTPYKAGGRRRSAGMSRPRKSRRSSSLFSRERKSLIDECGGSLDDSMEMEEGNSVGINRDSLLPFSVTIDPEEYTSPSSTSLSDSISTLDGSMLGTPSATSAVNDNEVMQTGEIRRDSACISPSSLRSSDLGSNNNVQHRGRDRHGESDGSGNGNIPTAAATAGRETPNSARTSSSTILRAVHASGALLPGIPGSNSPPEQRPMQQGGGRGGASCGSGGGGNGSGLLRPNQLKYSPSSSSGGSASTRKMDVSPSDSDSLGSDIMSLFTHHSLDDDSASNDEGRWSLGKQLSLLSEDLTQPLHINIGDLSLWMAGKRKDPATVMDKYITKGLSPLTFLSLIRDDTNDANYSKSMFYGNQKSVQPALSSENKRDKALSFIRKNFESMLIDEMDHITSSGPSPSRPTRTTIVFDADLESISSWVQKIRHVSSADWLRVELDAAERALSRSAETAKIERANGKQFISSCCEKLAETNVMIMQQLVRARSDADIPSSNNKQKLRKQQLQTQIADEKCIIESLEDELSAEVERLRQTKRAKRIFDANLEIERSGLAASVLAVEVRSSLIPGPVHIAGKNTDFYFPLLDGSAEVSIKILTPEEEEFEQDSNTSEGTSNLSIRLGCFIRDGGVAVKLLQAILLGDMKMKVDGCFGPYPLRKSLSSMALEDEGRELLLTHLLFKIDTHVRSVRDLEADGFCTVNETSKRGIALSVSMHHKGTVVQIRFLYDNILDEDWRVTTTPNDVKVSVVSAQPGLRLLGNQLEEKAKSMLVGSSGSDHMLLKRTCNEVVKSFACLVDTV